MYRLQYSYKVLSVLFFASFSSFFMTSLLRISPIYFALLFSLYFLLLIGKWKKIGITNFIVYIPLILLSIYFLFNSILNNTKYHDALVMFLFYLYYPIGDIIFMQIKKKDTLLRLVKIYFYIHFIYFFIDIIYRYKNFRTSEIPSWIINQPIYFFYAFKENSLIGDSNVIGAFCLVVFSVAYYVMKKKLLKKRFFYITVIFLLLTFSRATWLGAFALLSFYFYKHKVNMQMKIILLPFIVIIPIGIISFLSKDYSFLTKTVIFDKTYKAIAHGFSIKELFFGLGTNNSTGCLGRYAHNIISLMLIEYGFIGFFLLLLSFMFIIVDCGKNWWYVLLPYFIMSLSFTPVYLPHVFVGLLIVKYLNKYN